MPWWNRREREHDLERELQSGLELEAMEQQDRVFPRPKLAVPPNAHWQCHASEGRCACRARVARYDGF
jgi:hypothetical protein